MRLLKFDEKVDPSLNGKEFWVSHFEMNEDHIPWRIKPSKVRIDIELKYESTFSVIISWEDNGKDPLKFLQINDRWEWNSTSYLQPWDINFFNTKDEALDYYNSKIEDEIDNINDLLDTVKSFLEYPYKINPFDIVTYKPTNESGIVKSINKNGAFVLFSIQSTAKLCKWEDLEL